MSRTVNAPYGVFASVLISQHITAKPVVRGSAQRKIREEINIRVGLKRTEKEKEKEKNKKEIITCTVLYTRYRTLHDTLCVVATPTLIVTYPRHQSCL